MSIALAQQTQSASIRSYIDERAASEPDAIFLVDPVSGRNLSNQEVQTQVARIASAIAARGIEPGTPVAYAFSNSCDSALVIFGILYGGFLATAMNLVAGKDTLAYVLEHSNARLVIADLDAKEEITDLSGNVPVIQIDELLNNQNDAETEIAKNLDGGSDGLLMYTSGTTGRPKGVVLTQASLLAGGSNAMDAHKLTSGDCGLCVLPFYHINAFCVSLMGSLVSGSSLVVPRKFSVSSFWNIVRKNKCTWFSVVPTQISYLLHNADNPGGDASGCEHLRFGRSASAPLAPEIHKQFEERFNVPIIETMGLTETAAQILSNPLPPGTRKIGSPGRACGNEIRIGDDKQQALAPNTEGEILVRGPNVLRCYLHNEEATKAAITADGWLRTGDLGKIDEDGYVFVTGRLKELIIKGGENIAPREVDEALYSHPDVIEAAAFAVECKDYGQRVEAGVKLSETTSVSPEQLLELCREKIGNFKSPDKIHVLPELPKGPSGKIQRIKLAAMLA